MRSWTYNRFGVLMGTSGRASGPRWPSLRGDVLPMITLFPSQGDFCVTALTESASIEEYFPSTSLTLTRRLRWLQRPKGLTDFCRAVCASPCSPIHPHGRYTGFCHQQVYAP